MQRKSGSYNSWSGYAFELTCFQHYDNIANALAINDVSFQAKTYLSKEVQTDLLFDREDNVISLCEIKYAEKPLVIDKALATELKNRVQVFSADIKTKKDVFLAVISPFGIKSSIWAEDLVQNVVNLDDLMKP